MVINQKSLFVLFVLVIVLLPAVVACSSQEETVEIKAEPRVGKLAPDFILPSLDGGEIALSDYRGKPVLLNFWATWCSPCRIELPHLVSAYRGYADKELVVLAVWVWVNLLKRAGCTLPQLTLSAQSERSSRSRKVFFSVTCYLRSTFLH